MCGVDSASGSAALFVACITTVQYADVTLPITTAEAKRTFSELNRTATTGRASMDDDRLESLVVVQLAHRDLTPSNDEIIDRFAVCTVG